MKVINDLRQRHVEAYNKAIRESNITANDVTSPEWAGVVVRAAITANMLEDVDTQDVGDMRPVDVINCAAEVFKVLTAALTFKKKER